MRRSLLRHYSAPPELFFEGLEPRLVLAAVSWDGGAGTLLWHDAANWSTDAVPGIDDDVTIDAPASPTIEFGAITGNRAVRSLLTRNNIFMWGGTLTVATTATVQNSAVVRLTGITLSGGHWSAVPGVGSLEVGSTSTMLLGVSIAGELRFNASGSSATIGNGATFELARLVGANSSIRFTPGQTVTGQILFDGGALGDRSVKMVESGELTIGPTGRIAAAPGFAGTGRIGVPNDPGGLMTLVNHGTIAAALGRTIHAQPEQLTSTGTLRAASSGSLTIEPTGSWTSSGAIVADGTNSSVNLLGAWSNTGTISVNNARLRFGGTFTTAGMNLSQFTRVGGQVYITGTLDNSGSTLTLDNATGSWELARGTINGGSVAITGAANLTATGAGESFLNGTSVSGEFVVAALSRVTLDAGAAFATARLIGDRSNIGFTPGHVLTGTVLFDGVGGVRWVEVRGSDGALTIGPTGQILTTPSFSGTGRIGHGSGYGWPMTLVNEGVIAAAAGTLSVQPQSLTNTGTLRVSAGTLRTLPLTAWSNAGAIAVEGGTLDLAGTFSTAGGIGSWSRSGGAVAITGTLDNTNATTTLDSTTGSWMVSGTIAGGTMNLIDGQVLAMGSHFVSLTGVTVNGELFLGDISGASPGVTISGGTTFTTARLADILATVRFDPGQTLTGTIVLDAAATSSRIEINGSTPGTLTIGPTGQIVTAPGFTGSISIGSTGPAMTLVNEGFIGSSANGRTLQIRPAVFTNAPGGAVVASDGGTVEIASTFTNAGLLSGVTGILAITGTLNNGASTQTLSAATGTWHLKGGTITGGVINCTDGQALTMTGSGGTLSGVTVNGELSLLNISARVSIAGGTTFTLARLGGNSSRISFAPQHTVSGTILFEGAATGSRFVSVYPEGPLRIGPTGQIRAVADFAGTATIGGFSSGMNLLNLGLISSEVSGRALTIEAESLTNTGTLRALNGASLAISSPMWTNAGSLVAVDSTLTLTGLWTSTGTMSVPGSTITLGGTFSTPGLSSPQFLGAGATVNVTGYLANTGRTLSLDGDNGTWTLMGGTINGGEIELSGGQVLTVAGSQGTLSGVAVGGDILLASSVRAIIGVGTTFQRARLAASGARLTVAPGHVLSGTILFEGATGSRTVDMSPSGTFTVAPAGSIQTTPDFGGLATIGFGMTIINQGVIGSENAGGTVTVRPSTLTNAGTLRALDGGLLSISANTTTNFAAGVLTGGEWIVGTGSTLSATFGNILTNNATITLEGTALWARTGTITTNTGTLRLLGGRDHAVTAPFTNSGTLTLSPGSLLTADSFTQTVSGQLEVQISGADPATQTGRIIASGAASLDGRLDIIAVDGYVPAHPATFQFISAASVSGTFAESAVPGVAPHLRASILYDATGVRWRVTSIADIDGDGIVNSSDISAFLTTWLDSLTDGNLTGDFNGDGVLNSLDISAFLTAWLEAL